MKHIAVKWSKGVTFVPSQPDTPSENELTIHEQIINELYNELKILKQNEEIQNR